MLRKNKKRNWEKKKVGWKRKTEKEITRKEEKKREKNR